MARDADLPDLGLSQLRIPQSPPPFTSIDVQPGRLHEVMHQVLNTKGASRYFHWDKLRFLQPPGDLSREEWWWALKMGRLVQAKHVPLTDSAGRTFSYSLPDRASEFLHRIDQNAAGQIAFSEVVTNPSTRDRYIMSSLMEEAITSSQLEGAATTRHVAKEMIRSGRPPRDRSERMILNNFQAMHQVLRLRRRAITPELIIDLHRTVSKGTLSDPSMEGRMQRPGDERVGIWSGGHKLHTPPPAEELPGRLELLCAFANGTAGSGFVHPVIRAIVLHFWLGYDHPFEDGNGRTARALFYWCLLKNGYWLAEFTTISRILRAAPAKYARSFLYTESDDNDLTYFILYQLEVFVRALNELRTYLARKMTEIHNAEALIRQAAAFNHRQLAFLSHAIRHPDQIYTVASHQRSHQVAYETARSDLLLLERALLLHKARAGRAYIYTVATDLTERLKAQGYAGVRDATLALPPKA